jgi:E3 ubiquitin-protein ligase BRE1
MLEYKREKIALEARVQELEKSCVDHADHIRIVDRWWLQVCRPTYLL